MASAKPELAMDTTNGEQKKRDYISGYRGQDEFVRRVLGKAPFGTTRRKFLDIGCTSPTAGSNTWSLQRDHGWEGVLITRDPDMYKILKKERANNHRVRVVSDSKKGQTGSKAFFDWEKLIIGITEPHMVLDYLSIDVNDAALLLATLPLDKYKARIVTCAHKAFSDDGAQRDIVRKILAKNGYVIIGMDVMTPVFVPDGGEGIVTGFEKGAKGKMILASFEDWFIHKDSLLKEMYDRAVKMRNARRTGPEILGMASGVRTIQELMQDMNISDVPATVEDTDPKKKIEDKQD